MDQESLVFIHLSDIHFRKFTNQHFDLDKDLRNEIGLDTSRVKNQIDHVDAILVSGDIAFSGTTEEYDMAFAWLKQFCNQVDCELENVWVIPGNHDIDRSVVESSKSLKDFRSQMREVPPAEIDGNLDEYLRDHVIGNHLLEPLGNYNEFAFKFGCEIATKELYWDQMFPLNDNSLLRIRGMNSVLVSDHQDDNANYKLILPRHQSSMERKPGIVNLSLCHHPPQWLRCEDAHEDFFRSRVTLQLFGHKHTQRLNQIDNTLRISAGAVHPSRQEQNWQPRYNFISIKVQRTGNERALEVIVWPRIWDEAITAFKADVDSSGSEVRNYLFPIEPWSEAQTRPTTNEQPTDLRDNVIQNEVVLMNSSQSVTQNPLKDPKRKLAYLFFDLPFTKVITIATKLELLRDEDGKLQNIRLYQELFSRAVEKDILSELWEQVTTHSQEEIPESNPFKKREED